MIGCMFGSLRERFHQDPTKVKTTVIYNNNSFPLSYSPEQIGKDTQYVQTFLQRRDVTHALSQNRKSIHIRKATVTSQDGPQHDYLIIKQGKRKFLFDLPDDPSIQQDPSEMTLVVAKQRFIEMGFLPDGETNHFRPFQNWRDTRKFWQTVKQDSYFAGRYSGATVETNPDFLQPIPCIVVSDTRRSKRNVSENPQILFPLRNTENVGSDTRLSGMMVAPFSMGHSNITDMHPQRHVLKQANYRELAEETALVTKQPNYTKIFHIFYDRKGNTVINSFRIWEMSRYYRIKPVGILHVSDNEVDRVHAGVVFLAEPKKQNTVFALNGSSHENTKSVWRSVAQFQDDIAHERYTEAGWNRPIMQEVIAPYYQRRGRKS